MKWILVALLSMPFWLNPPGLQAQATIDEELQTDDGSFEDAVSLSSLIIVNRLTPPRYPATLKAVRVFFRQVNPSPVGQQIRLLAFARTPSEPRAPTNPTLLVDQRVTIPPVTNTGQFVEFAVQNGPTVTAGDFFVGFQQMGAANIPFFWVDVNGPQQQRAYASVDNGATYQGEVRLSSGNQPLINFMIRAVVSVPPQFAAVSAASFTAGGELAAEAIAAGFGSGLANGTAVAATLPLPTTLGGASVRVRDSAGTERLAPLFFAAPMQINFLLPPDTANGAAAITVTNGATTVAAGTVQVDAIAPGLFAANANGQGVAAATVFRLRADGSQRFESAVQFDQAQQRFVAVPIDLGPEGDQVFLILNGTGIRRRSAVTAVTASIGGANAEVLFAGPQTDFVGLDQVNLRIPRPLAGRGEVDVRLTVDGKAANLVRVNLR